MPALVGHGLNTNASDAATTTTATTAAALQVVCAWPVSGQYGPGSRVLYVYPRPRPLPPSPKDTASWPPRLTANPPLQVLRSCRSLCIRSQDGMAEESVPSRCPAFSRRRSSPWHRARFRPRQWSAPASMFSLPSPLSPLPPPLLTLHPVRSALDAWLLAYAFRANMLSSFRRR